MRMPRIVLAAAASGSGKTTVTCGILKAPADRGITAASFKCGPDYIDPLIVDCRSMSLSIVPVIKGFLEYKENSHIRGVILNRISPSLYERMKPVIEEELSIRVLGYLPYNREIALESRHLGLVTPDDAADTGEKFDRLAKLCEETVRMDDLIRLAEEASDMEDEEEEPYGLNGMQTQSGRRVRIAVSKDEAFCFWYEENLRLLSELGAEPVEFSPLRDPGLPEGGFGTVAMRRVSLPSGATDGRGRELVSDGGSAEGRRIPGRKAYEVRVCRDYGEPVPQLSESTRDWRIIWN